MAKHLRGVLILGLLLAAPAALRAQSSSSAPTAASASVAPAGQDFLSLPTQSIHYGSWELGGFFGGGMGMGHDSNTTFLFGGVRAGRVLTDDHGPRGLRGNFEMLGEIRPVYEILTPANGHIYGFHFMPVILRWNFKGWHRVAPYGQLAGGMLFSTAKVPPGPTSSVNFTPQGAAGVNIFTKPGQAVAIEFVEFHHSNANLGDLNPGYNAGFLFTIGYMWFHGWRK
jgi:Lipid A 3-O-deacylase (PagL)